MFLSQYPSDFLHPFVTQIIQKEQQDRSGAQSDRQRQADKVDTADHPGGRFHAGLITNKGQAKARVLQIAAILMDI